MIKRQMQDEFVKLIKKVKKTIVFVTHDLHEALRIANHIAIMKDGYIVQQGTPAEIVLKPAKGYVEEFVQDLPKTKFITGQDIMEKPDDWVMPISSSANKVFDKMTEKNIRFAFLADENGRIQKTVDYFVLGPLIEAQTSINDISEYELSPSYQLASVSSNTFLESILSKAADTKVPIVVNDTQGIVQGVISREIMLQSLQSA